MTTVLHYARGRSFDGVVDRYPDVEFVALDRAGPLSTLGSLGPADVLLTASPHPSNLADALALPVGWIHSLDTGVNDFPLELVGDRVLTCGRGANATAIAEWVVAVILSDQKQLPDRWLTEPPERWYVADLGMVAGSTVAILGFGEIGQQVARRCLGLDMAVRALRRRQHAPGADGVTVVQSLSELVDGAEHLVIAAPLTPKLRHVLDDDAFAVMAPGVHIINVGRGAHIDQDALRRALDADIVRLASLDVCDPEPLPAGHWLYQDPRVRLSAHVSWNDPDATTRLYEVFADNLGRFRAGQPLGGVVDVDAGY
ncbi:MAG: NAD(P)-dependent oxidoreductase [Acidimicrobiales bacterium]